MRYIFSTLFVFILSLPAYASSLMGVHYCELFKDITINTSGYQGERGDITAYEGDMLKLFAKGPNDYVHRFKVNIEKDQLVFSKGEKAVFETPVGEEKVFDKFKITNRHPLFGVTAKHEEANIKIQIDDENNFLSTTDWGLYIQIRFGKCEKF